MLKFTLTLSARRRLLASSTPPSRHAWQRVMADTHAALPRADGHALASPRFLARRGLGHEGGHELTNAEVRAAVVYALSQQAPTRLPPNNHPPTTTAQLASHR